jgi:hypothetical protein
MADRTQNPKCTNNNIVMFDAVVSESGDWGDFWCSRGEGKKKEVTSQEAACYKSLLS